MKLLSLQAFPWGRKLGREGKDNKRLELGITCAVGFEVTVIPRHQRKKETFYPHPTANTKTLYKDSQSMENLWKFATQKRIRTPAISRLVASRTSIYCVVGAGYTWVWYIPRQLFTINLHFGDRLYPNGVESYFLALMLLLLLSKVISCLSRPWMGSQNHTHWKKSHWCVGHL